MAEPPSDSSWGKPARPTVSDRLPEEVVTCLQNARFLHLATCTSNIPHVSLMNYTYLPPHARPAQAPPTDSTTTTTTASPPLLPAGPAIIMTSNPHSQKTRNLLTNPHVSLLVHDWVSARPPAAADIGGSSSDATGGHGGGEGAGGGARDRSPAAGRRSSALATMLMQMNSAAVSSISATLNGRAHVLAPGSAEERWCKEMHLANNTFVGGGGGGGGEERAALAGGPVRRVAGFGGGRSAAAARREGDGGRESYIEDEEVRVVVVQIRDGRISDWKGGVKDWVIGGAEKEGEVREANGV